MTKSQNAFVILPFEEEFEELYEQKIAPIIEEKGYDINKADSMASQRAIIEDIINGITNADLVVADLTGTNPNVFYELGIAHGLGVPTILIAQDIGELPFDLSAYKTIEYSLLFSEIGEFEQELSNVVENHSSGNIEFGSPVSDYGNVEISQMGSKENKNVNIPKTAGTADDKPLNGEEVAEKDVLEYVSGLDEKVSDLEDMLSEISDYSHYLESEIVSYNQGIQDISATKNKATRKRSNKTAREMAQSLSTYSDSIESRINPIDDLLTYIMESIHSFINLSDMFEKEHREMLKDLYMDLDDFIREIESTIGEITQFNKKASDLRGVNRELDHSIRNLNDRISSLESILQEGVAKAERFNSLIENKFNESNIHLN